MPAPRGMKSTGDRRLQGAVTLRRGRHPSVAWKRRRLQPVGGQDVSRYLVFANPTVPVAPLASRTRHGRGCAADGALLGHCQLLLDV